MSLYALSKITEDMVKGTFVDNCGEKSLKILEVNELKKLNLLGEQKEIWPQILSIVLLISTIISGAMGYGKPSKDSKKKPLSETTKTICKIIFWISLFCLIPMSGFSLFKYMMYLKDFKFWYKNLSSNCKRQYRMGNAVRQLINAFAKR